MSSVDTVIDHLRAIESARSNLQDLGCRVLSFWASSEAELPRIHIAVPTAELEAFLDLAYVSCTINGWTEFGCHMHGCRIFWMVPLREPVQVEETIGEI
jgi:hypothetical protein